MNTKQWVTLIVVAIIFAGGGFFGGMKYQQSKTPVRAAGAAGLRGQAFGAGGRAGAAAGSQFLNGIVLSKDAQSFTVKMQNGSSKIVLYSGSTSINKTVGGTADDIIVGNQIVVTGSTNSDGSLTAQNVQIRTASSTPPGTPPGIPGQ
jgi:hypothetical protein